MVLASTSGECQTSRLRLAAARHRITAFISQIGELEASSFPHDDGKEALAVIRKYSEGQLARLDVPPDADPGVVDGVCQQIALAVQQYTAILGFILRSTNVRNPFELHFHLKALLRAVVGEAARLLLSSEWNFVPFTYPMNLGLLPNFALVGIPAPESGNVLVTPLAGHEIAHSAWLGHGLKSRVEPLLLAGIDEAMEQNALHRDRLIDSLKLGPLGRQRIRQGCLDAGILQLEEIFCDAFGLYVFGSSYLHAFEYFLAPGGGGRSLGYPSDFARIRYLQDGASRLNLKFDPPLFERWYDSVPDANLNADFVLLIDRSVEKAVPAVTDLAFALLSGRGISPPDEEAVRRIEGALSRSEPDSGGGTLAEVVTAGWRYVRAKSGMSDQAKRDEFITLGDLMLKSVEVSEYLLRVNRNA